METCEMVCKRCFYGYESYDRMEIEGRDLSGIEKVFDEIVVKHTCCKALPTHRVISEINGEIQADPDFHTCGLGRWLEETGNALGPNRIVSLLEAEDAWL